VSEEQKGRRRPGGDAPPRPGGEAEADALLEELSTEAQREKSEIDARAEEQLREIAERTEAELRRLHEEAEQQVKRLLDRERAALRGRYRLEEQRRRLVARRQLVEQVFAQAALRIEELRRSEGYSAALKRLVGQAAQEAGAAAQIVVAESEVELVRRLVGELGLECSVQGEGLPVGTLLARSPDGLRQVDNGLTGRLERARSALEEEVARLLWGTTTT
jgi:vacuolar-type H+-ATPase subunit E/Vma4